MTPTRLQTKTDTRPGDQVPAPPEQAVIEKVGGAMAHQAERQVGVLDDPRQAARHAAVEIASAMLDACSAETAAHSDDVDVITEGIARRLGLDGQRLDDAMLAARLHDIGKLGVPQSIINKPDSLDRSEWKLMHRHTIIGEQILLAVPELRGVAWLVRHSHERWDGDGYPDGLAGEEIPLGSRIVFCADAYHAIRSDRPYRKGRSARESLDEIRANAGTQFDPVVVAALEAVAAEMRAAARNGNRPRATRPRRLMALMLIISVGACGSAFARSGILPEATGPAAAGSSPAGSGTGALAAGAPTTAAMEKLDSLNASRLGANPGLVPAVGLLSALPPALELPTTPGAAGVGEGPVDGSGQPDGEESPGVRDHGQGIGRGKGKGKARGAAMGRGHQKPKTSKSKSSAKGRAKSGVGAARGSSRSSAANSKPKSSSGGSSSKSAGQTAGVAKQPPAPKPARPPKPPAPPAAAPAPEAPATPGPSSGAASGNSGGNANPGGNPGGGNG